MIRRVQLGLLSVAAIAFVTALVLASTAHDAMAAPNLVTNGDFATNVNGWTTYNPPGDVSSVWDSSDAQSNPASGSANVVWNAAGLGVGTVSHACIDLTASGAGPYELAGEIRNPVANGPGVLLFLRVELFTDTGCTTPAGTTDGADAVPNTNNWIAVSENVTVTTELGAIVSLVIDSDDATSDAFFDNVSLSNGPVDTPTPTSTNTPTNTPTPTDTAVPPTPTDTPVPPTPTDTPVPPTPTDTPVPPTPTDTPLPPTATNTPGGPTDTPTNTPVATDTPLPTNTPVPTATNTPVPPTATNTAAATNTPAATNTAAATTTSTPMATNTAAATETATSEPTATETAVPVATEPVGLPPASGAEAPASTGGAGGAGGDPSGAGELPETGTGTEAVKDLTLPLVIAGILALIGAMSLAGVEYHRIRQ